MAEGFLKLVRNRKRQDAHARDIHRRFPDLRRNEDDKTLSAGDILRLLSRRPVGFVVYATVALLTRLPFADAATFRSRA